jgi:hypothetical protein
VLARSRRREEVAAPVRTHLRRRIAERSGLGESASDSDLHAAAVRLGIAESDADAIVQRTESDRDLLALGRALAVVEGESRP